MRETFMAGDIGGTNTRLRIFEVLRHDVSIQNSSKLKVGHEAPGTLLLKRSYQNQDFHSFGDVVRAFLKEAAVSKPPVSACLAVAGPVKHNVVRFTNRDSWEIDGDQIGEELGIKKVFLINDFVAAGYGVLTLNTDVECITLQKATMQSTAPIACIGAGTGLGQCYLTPSGDHGESGDYRCFPSEGGHAEFAPRDELEFGLQTFLKERFKSQTRASVERIVSGTGLSNVYDYLCGLYPHKIDAGITELIAAAGDMKGSVIAKNPQNELCKKTMELFVTAYGAEAGVAALKWLPYGGLYLCGGLTPKNIDLIKDPQSNFMTALLDKGRVHGLLSQVPVYAVMVEDLGERGAHYMAYKEFCREMHEPPVNILTAVPLYVGGESDITLASNCERHLDGNIHGNVNGHSNDNSHGSIHDNTHGSNYDSSHDNVHGNIHENVQHNIDGNIYHEIDLSKSLKNGLYNKNTRIQDDRHRIDTKIKIRKGGGKYFKHSLNHNRMGKLGLELGLDVGVEADRLRIFDMSSGGSGSGSGSRSGSSPHESGEESQDGKYPYRLMSGLHNYTVIAVCMTLISAFAAGAASTRMS